MTLKMGLTLLLLLLSILFPLSYGLNDFESNKTDVPVVVCSEFGQVEHGHVKLLENIITDDSSQQIVHIECSVGYDLDGPPKISCVDGRWEQHARPHCIARCRSPPYVKNGEVEIDREKDENGMFEKGVLATYTCSDGYELSQPDSKYRVCEKGIWTGSMVNCVPTEKIMGCKPPDDIINGYFVHEKAGGVDGFYSIGQRVHYSCNSGFVLIGTAAVQQCIEDGTWSPKIPPICIPPTIDNEDYPCNPAPSVPHAFTTVIQGFQNSKSALSGTEVEIRCIAKYRNTRAPCQASKLRCIGGQWIGNIPICVVAKDCPYPPTVVHGSPYDLNPGNSDIGRIRYSIGSQISYQCLPGYELQGNYILTCSPGGCWTPSTPPTCKINSHFYLEVNSGGPMLISIATGAVVLLLLLIICLAIVCRRRKPLSRAVPLPPPVPRPDLADHAALLHHPDRLALIAFADGIQVGQSLPTYEEAIRDRGSGVQNSRMQRPHWPSLAHGRRARNSPDVVHVTRQGSFASHSASTRSGGDPMGSTDTMVVSEGSTAITLDTASSHSGSQSASCRVHCGSLASFDTSSVHNTEGVPLLEESELEEIQADTCSLALENRSMADDSSFKLYRASPDLD